MFNEESFKIKKVYHFLIKKNKTQIGLKDFEDKMQDQDKETIDLLYDHYVENLSLRKLAEKYQVSHEKIRKFEKRLFEDFNKKRLDDMDVSYDTKVKECLLPRKVVNSLTKNNIIVLNDLKNLSDDELLAMPGIYNACMKQINLIVAYVSGIDLVREQLNKLCEEYDILPVQLQRIATVFAQESK